MKLVREHFQFYVGGQFRPGRGSLGEVIAKGSIQGMAKARVAEIAFRLPRASNASPSKSEDGTCA
ncbi:MAG: hypothetical protein QM784_29840 [Polyangiaceae bacterium]